MRANIREIQFPIYKLRSHFSIDKKPSGKTVVTSASGKYVLDDTSISGSLGQRRLKLQKELKDPATLYPLSKQYLYLRHLVKCKPSDVFIDDTGRIFSYKKSRNLNTVQSYKVHSYTNYENRCYLYNWKFNHPFQVGTTYKDEYNYISIIHTKWGPFLYDITEERHEPYKRAI